MPKAFSFITSVTEDYIALMTMHSLLCFNTAWNLSTSVHDCNNKYRSFSMTGIPLNTAWLGVLPGGQRRTRVACIVQPLDDAELNQTNRELMLQ